MNRKSHHTGRVLQELLKGKVCFNATQQAEERLRRLKLNQFLQQHAARSEWSVSLSALNDAVAHGVAVPTDALTAAMNQCATGGKFKAVKHIYTSLFRKLQRPRPLTAHIAFMEACASCGVFGEAKQQLDAHVARDVALHQRDGAHRPVVNSDLMTAYLRAALASHVLPSSQKEAKDGDGAAWKTALADLVRLRSNSFAGGMFRQHITLTPLLLESAAQLSDVGGDWQFALRLLRSSELVPSEVYDAVIRVCYRHGRYQEVVTAMAARIATRDAPDEQSTHLAIVAAEEVEAAGGCTAAAGSPDAAVPSAWALSLQLFQALRLNGLPLHQQSYESPLRSCVAASQWEFALQMLQEMKKDSRPISGGIYRLVVAARMKGCTSFEEVERFLYRLDSLAYSGNNTILYQGAMQWCLEHEDWQHLERLHREMRAKEIPESYDKMRLMMEAAYCQGRYHAVLVRFARFINITGYEEARVKKDASARWHPSDFEIPSRLLDMVIDAYEQLRGVEGGHRDAMTTVAWQAALDMRKKKDSNEERPQSNEAPEWMYSTASRRSDGTSQQSTSGGG